MSINWNKGLDQTIKLLVIIFKPSFAKALSLPLLMSGIGILNSPLWLDGLNFVLSHQDFLPQYKAPIMDLKENTGWIFIALSIFIFLIDTWKSFKAGAVSHNEIINEINEQPLKTATLVVEKLNHFNSTSPHIVDKEIYKRSNELKVLRFFGTFPIEDKSIQLANSILDGELSGGSSEAKALGLALSARFLSVGDNITLAKRYLKQSKKLFSIPEANIAEAFIKATEFDTADGISILVKQRTSANYSAIFMLKRNRESSKSATDWFKNTGLTILNFDVDGQISYIQALLEMGDWEHALDVVNAINNEPPTESPALVQLSAFTFLTNAIKVIELRKSVMQQLPFAADTFPLADDIESIKLRTQAVTLFKRCSTLLSDLGLSEAVDICRKYALWLELRNPCTHEISNKKLHNIISNYSIESIEYLPLADAFKIDIDYQKIENELNRQTALCNDTNPTLGIARFVLALNQKRAPKVIEYINIHRNQLEKHIDITMLRMLEVEALAKAGLTEDAENLLKSIEKSRATSHEIKKLTRIIASVKGENPITLAISQYYESKNVSDLSHLVSLLEQSELKEKYRSCALELFNITGAETDALKVANATLAVKKFSDLHQFLNNNFGLVERSAPLAFHWAWSLFRKGDFDGVAQWLSILKDKKNNNLDLQTLDTHLAIYTGNWDALTVFVESKWKNRSELNAEQLLRAAQLAKAQAPRRAKELLEYATSKFPEDPKVLASAYFTATTMGWEDNKNTKDWLNKAAVLSTSEGPLHMVSFDEIKDIMAAQSEQNNKVYQAYEDGTAPIFTIAQLLNRTLSDFYLIQPLENLKTTDIRKKSLIGAFHSTREVRIIEGDVISIDASSTLVLGFLEMLDLLFDSFLQIIVPHSLMKWLYDEKQKIAFHQPSQIQKAQEFEALVSDGDIKIIEPTKIEEPELALNVGDELAFLMMHAKEQSSVESQNLVVCSYPVYKIGGFREQEVNLSKYKNNLSSCISLVKKLKDIEAITEVEYQKASQYLLIHDKEWPSALEIDDNASIFLDSLAVTYLMTTGMLDKFKDTELRIFVHTKEFDKYKKLRHFDSTISEADIKIEKIRSQLFEGIQSGKIIFSEMQISILDSDKSNNETIHPTEELFQALTKSNAALIDDRCINQHENFAINNKNTSIYTTIDFIETLCANQLITEDKKFLYYSKLRMAGFGLVPITIEELNYHLAKSSISDGVLRPSKELKLIKENLSLLKINRLIKLPRDAHWFHSTLFNLSNALKQQWTNDTPSNVSRARSNWLYELLDFRGWSHCFDIRNEEGMAYFGETIRVNSILISPVGISNEMKDQYNEWLEYKVLQPLKKFDIESYEALIESIKLKVEKLSEQDLLEGSSDEKI